MGRSAQSRRLRRARPTVMDAAAPFTCTVVPCAAGALKLILLLLAGVALAAAALVAAWLATMLENALADAYGYTAVSTQSTSPT